MDTKEKSIKPGLIIKKLISKKIFDLENDQYKLHHQIWSNVGLRVHSSIHSVCENITYHFTSSGRDRILHPTFNLHDCEVCQKLTCVCTGSPFRPIAGFWRCTDCRKNKRLPYIEILKHLKNTKSYDDALEKFVLWWESGSLRSLASQLNDVHASSKEYFESYSIPTLKFYNKTPREAWEEAQTLK
jgi:hypothetical protein